MVASRVTEPGEQKVVGPAAVILAVGYEFTVTTMMFDVELPQELLTMQS